MHRDTWGATRAANTHAGGRSKRGEGVGPLNEEKIMPGQKFRTQERAVFVDH